MISKTFDWIERMVTPAKSNPDPLSISNNTYGQWGTTPSAGGYQQYTAAQQAGLGGYQTAVQQGNYIVSNYPVVGVGSNVTYYQPPMTGTYLTVAFTDAHGVTWALPVDQAYAQMMSQMSANHAATYGTMNQANQAPYGFVVPATAHEEKIMVEDDFSFDEMEEAERLILELEGAVTSTKKGQEAQGATKA